MAAWFKTMFIFRALSASASFITKKEIDEAEDRRIVDVN